MKFTTKNGIFTFEIEGDELSENQLNLVERTSNSLDKYELHERPFFSIPYTDHDTYANTIYHELAVNVIIPKGYVLVTDEYKDYLNSKIESLHTYNLKLKRKICKLKKKVLKYKQQALCR